MYIVYPKAYSNKIQYKADFWDYHIIISANRHYGFIPAGEEAMWLQKKLGPECMEVFIANWKVHIFEMGV